MSPRALEHLKQLVGRIGADPADKELHKELIQLVQAFQDESDRSEMEARHHLEQIARAARLAELGTMAAAVFHEMAQPLLGIKGFAELLADHVKKGKLEQVPQWTSEIRTQVTRIQEMQRRIGTFLKPEQGSIGPVKFSSALDEALQLFNKHFSSGKIKFGKGIPDDLPPVLTNRDHLVQILVNLIRNALDAQKEQAAADLRIAVRHLADENQVSVLVTDSGPGVEANLQEQLFEPFFTTKGKDGSGLGLYISKKLAESNEGDLRWVEPESLGWSQVPGAAFELTLKVAGQAAVTTVEKATDAGEQIPQSTGDLLRKKLHEFTSSLEVTQRVLLVDDEQIVQGVLAEYLANQNILADCVASAEEGLERLEGRQYAVVITDKNLPGMDGIDLLKTIKSRWPTTEVLVITGYSSIDSALEAIALGAFDYIPKPFPHLSYAGDKTRAALARYDFEIRTHALIEHMTTSYKALFSESKAGDAELVKRLEQALASFRQDEEVGRVLVIGPATMARTVEGLGYEVESTEDLEQGLEMAEAGAFDVTIYVESAIGTNAAEAARALRVVSDHMGILAIAKDRDLKQIVDAIGAGVGDYLLRPLEGRELLEPRLKRLVSRQQRVTRYRNLIQALNTLNIDLMVEGHN